MSKHGDAVYSSIIYQKLKALMVYSTMNIQTLRVEYPFWRATWRLAEQQFYNQEYKEPHRVC